MNKTTLTHRFTKRLPLVLIATLLAVLALAGALALLGALGTGPPVAHAWPVTPMPSPAPPATRPPGPAFVKPGGTGGWCLQDDPCGSIQYAIDECEPGNGDTIYVAAGTYTNTVAAVITVTKSVTIYGGWNGAASGAVVRDPDTHITKLDGENTRRGVFVSGTVTVTLDGLRITRGKVSGSGVEGQGGGAYIVTATVTIADCHIYSNTANKSGGGLYLYQSDGAILRDNRIYSNTATSMGGGLFLNRSPATLSGNTVTGNTANMGGGLYLLHSDATLSENTITGNADRGLSLHFSDATLVNNVVADNQTDDAGGGLFIAGSSPRLLHTTIARNSGGDGSGVYVTSNSTVALTNTILVSHTVGITATTGSTATLNATLWHANDTDWGGEGTIVTGTHNYWGDPTFVDPDAGDYHIGAGSAALDKGVDAGVPTDKDGVSRPQGTAPDVGAYEQLPPQPPVPVGGIIVPVNKLGLLAPWLGLAALAGLAALTVVLVRRRRA